jgi:hypothetical protein
MIRELAIRVTSEVASIYESASEQERRKLDALLSLRLSEIAQLNRSINQHLLHGRLSHSV